MHSICNIAYTHRHFMNKPKGKDKMKEKKIADDDFFSYIFSNKKLNELA